MPVTSAPRRAIASARMPPPQPTSSTFLPARPARSSIHCRRSGLISCSGRNSPCGSHQREASALNFSSSAGSTFIREPFSQKKAPPKRGLFLRWNELPAGAGGRTAGAGRSRAAGARRRAARAGGRRRRAAARGAFAAAEELGVDATVGLQAGDQLLVLVALLAQFLALVAGHWIGLAPAFHLETARVDAA